MKGGNKIADELLVKYLLGEATRAESSDVEAWIKENSAHKNEFDSFRLIWEQSRQLAVSSSVSEDAAWARFNDRLQPARPQHRTIPVPARYTWLKVAAALVLLAGGSWLMYLLNAGDTHTAAMASKAGERKTLVTIPAATQEAREIKEEKIASEAKPAIKQAAIAKAEPQAGRRKLYATRTGYRAEKNAYSKGLFASKSPARDYICNSTPCAIEICIIQTVKCKNDKASAVASCSVLEPDQSGKLKYKAFDKIAKNCRATVDEIRITSVATGETIVLNDHSTPSTAQDFFNHLTGKQKGDVYAGMFHSECNASVDNCGLTFDGNFGNFTMQ